MTSTDEISLKVHEFLAIDTQIKAAASDMKKLRQAASELRKYLTDELVERDVTDIQTGDVTITVTMKRTPVKISKDQAMERASVFFTKMSPKIASGEVDMARAAELLFTFMYETDVPTRESHVLSVRRAKPKVKKEKDEKKEKPKKRQKVVLKLEGGGSSSVGVDMDDDDDE